LSKKRIGLDGRALGNLNRYRGIGRYTAHLIESLVQAGNDFQFVLFGYGQEPDSELLNHRFSSRLEWREIPKPRKPSFSTLLSEHLLFAQAVKDARVNLFHGIDHNMTPFLSCPFILTVHDLIPLVLRGPYLGPTAWLWMQAHRFAARKARFVIAVSEATLRDINRIWSIPLEHIIVIPEGVAAGCRPVEDGHLVKKITSKYDIKKPYFLYLGGFDPRKNIFNMLLAFKRFLIKTGDAFQFVLCGDTEGFEGYLMDEIEEMGLRGRVIHTGYVPDSDLPALYSGATAFIFVSIYEGFGLPLIEAMACGSPVLASGASSIPEVVGDAGLLVDPLDPAEIVTGMEQLAYNQALRKELIKRGLRRSSLFTWDSTAGRILMLYNNILEGGGQG